MVTFQDEGWGRGCTILRVQVGSVLDTLNLKFSNGSHYLYLLHVAKK